MEYQTKEPLPGKGEEDKRCNVTQCQCQLRPGRQHFNVVMRAWYCQGCAVTIQRVDKALILFPSILDIWDQRSKFKEAGT